MIDAGLARRFWPKVDVKGPDECWLWLAAAIPAGYGVIGASGGRGAGTLYAHRVSFEIAKGPIPEGLVIDHLCDTPLCVNPQHLEAVTQQHNCERGERGRKTTCPHGHPLDGWRRHYVKPLGRHITHRYCITCEREAGQRRRDAARAAA